MSGQLEVEGAAPAGPSEVRRLLAGPAPPAELRILDEAEQKGKKSHITASHFWAPRDRRGSPHLSVRRGVDDVVDRGWRGQNRNVGGFEVLDPVAELRPVQTRHHDGVDQLPWEERRTKVVIRPSRWLECATLRLSLRR